MRNRLRQLLAPPTFHGDDEKMRVASLLNVLLLALTVIFTINTINASFYGEGLPPVLINATTIFVTLGLLFILHRRHVRLAVWLTISIFFVLVTLVGFWLTGLSIILITSYMVLVLLAGLLAGPWASAAATALAIVLGGLMLSLESEGLLAPTMVGSRTINATAAAGNLVALTVILNLTLRDLNRALTQLRQSNQQLQETQASLEIRVAERTRDLALAAEVGRSVSQVRDLKALLHDAVNLIRDRFDLYYVQIYLTDQKHETLRLEAGTGQIGELLVQRHHRLPFGAGSINGLAAAEKRPVVVPDTAVSPLFKPHTLLPETRSEMAVPLLAGKVVWGVLNLQSSTPGSLTDDSLSAFEALASQIAIAIENANLFTEMTQAQAEAESYLRRLTREGWDSYLDAVQQREVLGFTHDRESLQPLQEPVAPLTTEKNGIQLPIVIADEAIGLIQLEADDDRFWTEETLALVTAVARQVGQQVENLRLLEETDRYRHEAEQAARRLRGEAWRDYLADSQELGQGFVYDRQQIKPLDEEEETGNGRAATTIRQPLEIQGETFGELAIAGTDNEEAQELAAAVAAQLSSHLESLRLSAQIENALAQTDLLYQIGRDLHAADTVAAVLQAVFTPFQETGLNEASLNYIDVNSAGEPEWLEIAAQWRSAGGSALVGSRFYLPEHPVATLVTNNPDQALLIADVTGDERVGDDIRERLLSSNHRAVALIPLTAAGQWVGFLSFGWAKPHLFSQQEEIIFNALTNLVTPAAQSLRLFAQTRRQAEKERVVNAITQRIQSTMTIESAMETAITELGNALQARYTQAELSLVKESVHEN